MKFTAPILLTLVLLAAGCGNPDTSEVRVVSPEEVKQGQDVRIAEIEKNPNLTPEQKEQMKQAILGNIPGKNGPEAPR